MFRRYAALVLVTFVVFNLWTLGLYLKADIAFLLVVGGASLGLLFACALFYRRDWLEITAFFAFVKNDHFQLDHDARLRRKVSARAARGYVYVLQDVDVTGFCKIGKTTTPVDRLTHFDVKLPFAVRLVHVIETHDCSRLEAVLHNRFASKRVRGEWFKLTDADIAWLLQLETA